VGVARAEVPSHPSQAYEAFGTVLVILVVLTLLTLGRFERKAGGVFLLGIALWAIARAAWPRRGATRRARAPEHGAGARASVAAGMLALLALNVVATSRRPDAPVDEPAVVDTPDEPDEPDGPSWADPTSRPRI
jgi:prolipoprotein diacylglyceryltransferase